MRSAMAFVFGLLAGVTPAAASDEELDKVAPFETLLPASVEPVRAPCQGDECKESHAIVFIHGIYGSAETFQTATFNWPKSIPEKINGKRVDVYMVEYKTQLLAWAKKDIAN